MSIEVMTYVWKHSQQKGSALLLLLAIADHAHDDGTGAYPSVETLAAKARMTSRNVQYLLRTLASSKELIIEPGAGPKGANIYSIPLDIAGGVKTFQGETQRMEGVKPVSPKPSLEPSCGGIDQNHHHNLLSLFSDAEQQDLRAKYPTLDFEVESQKCVSWWLEGSKPMKRPRTAYLNWLDKAATIKANINGHNSGNGMTRGAPPMDRTEFLRDAQRRGMA